MDGDADALADSIRKAWTQKSSDPKQASGSNPGLLRSGRRKNLVSSDRYLPAYISVAFSASSFIWLAFGIDHPHVLPVISELFATFQAYKISSGNGRDT